MVGSDEELHKAQERDSAEPASPEEKVGPAEAEPSEERLLDIAPARPEDVARKILRDALKSFPIPGKK